jgi:hypothetical protein
MVLLSTQTASASTSIDFTALDTTTYSSFMIMGYNVVPVNNAVNLLMRFSVSGTFAATSYDHQQFRWVSAGSGTSGQTAGAGTGIPMNATGDTLANTGTGVGIDFTVTCHNLLTASFPKKANGQSTYLGSASIGAVISGTYRPNSAVDGIRFLFDSGNISSGTFKLFGIR